MLNSQEIEKDRRLKDGVYDVTDIEFIENNPSNKVDEFIRNNPDWVYAEAYETNFGFLLSRSPQLLSRDFCDKNWHGSGFNYGSTNIITNCPKSILILAEND